MQSRDEIRREMRSRRRALPTDERSSYAAAIAGHILTSRVFHAAKSIAGYFPVQGEADPSLVLENALAAGKHVYLPVLPRLRGTGLCFARFDAHTTLRSNRLGIPEPVHHPRALARGLALDLVLTPLVAFDTKGTRLGMGGGFYDRSFAYLAHRSHWRRPLLIGFAYAFQEVQELPREDWDVPLSGVATEDGLRFFD